MNPDKVVADDTTFPTIEDLDHTRHNGVVEVRANELGIVGRLGYVLEFHGPGGGYVWVADTNPGNAHHASTRQNALTALLEDLLAEYQTESQARADRPFQAADAAWAEAGAWV